MTFASPLFLAAALAGLIPVLLHLVHRRKAREIRFSTLRFLRASVQRTRRRKYVEDLSLLLVRVAVLMLIAVGLARPALVGLAAHWHGGRTTAIAIVLDNSASMAVAAEGRTRFEAARRGAEEILARLRPGNLVALLPTSGPPAPELGRLFRTHETVRQALDQCRPSYERADLAARIRQARAVLDRADAPNEAIYVFTDNQRLSWEGLEEPRPDDDAVGRKTASRGRRPPLIVVNVQGDPAPNVVLKALSLESPAPVAGASFQAVVEVVNTAAVPQQKHVELHVDGHVESVSPTLGLAPGGTVKHAFRFTLDQPGVHRGEVRLAEDDGCPADNRQYFTVTLDQQVPVAIVKPRLDEVPLADDAFYLERALAPVGSTGGTFKVTNLTPESLASENLSAFAVIFCVNLPAVAPAGARRLRDYAHDGGHVFWICGRNVQPAGYNAMNVMADRELLPAMLEDLRQPLPGGVEGWHVGFLDKDYPPLAPLTEPASLYQSILVTRHFPMRENSRGMGRVLMKLDDGQPLLVEQPLGTGSVLLLGAGVHVDWTNLPVKPIFLPLLTRLTFHLAGTETERTMAVAGAPVAIPVGSRANAKSVAEIEVIRPSGEVVRVREAGPAAGTFRYADTHEAGNYLARPVDRQSARPFGFAINIDPAEVDPATISREELQARLGEGNLLWCENPADLVEAVRRLQEGTSLWEWFLAAVLIGLVVEVFLANRRGVAIQPAIAPAAPAAAAAATVEPIPTPVENELRGFLEHLGEDAKPAAR
ncbi:MAG: vWA domain-containing protein [Isosphaeraceae bacterium]